MRKIPSTPETACAKVAGEVRSPIATSTCPSHAATLAASRVNARTFLPAAKSCFTTSLPTFPVAPVMRYILLLLFLYSLTSTTRDSNLVSGDP